MFNYIRGTVADKIEGALIIENGGMGWEVFVSAGTLLRAEQGAEVRLFTYFQVKEDGAALFGFLTKEEKSMFLKLIAVGGVGCRLAITLLSGISARDLALSVLYGDVSALTRVKGVGKKTAERIILELKETVDCAVGEQSAVPSANAGGAADAVLALTALGFSKSEAERLIRDIQKPDMTAEELITQALKKR